MEKRDARFKGGGVSDGGKVMGFLDRARTKHAKANLAARHDVGVIPKNRERMGRKRASGDMHAKGRELARDFVHVGDHEQQALGGRKSGRQGPGR